MNIEEYQIIFGTRLRELREERKQEGFTQEYLAHKLGCLAGKISNMENGKSAPKFEDLIIIAELFDVSIDYLLGRTKNKKVNKIRSEISPPEKVSGTFETKNKLLDFDLGKLYHNS